MEEKDTGKKNSNAIDFSKLMCMLFFSYCLIYVSQDIFNSICGASILSLSLSNTWI